ncbi:MAG: M48 family metalloprotease [Candidatus Nanopelagicales bacterium]|nr:M48 family metalloprotease [Candidatus Nanopelagicales bacterium]
MIKWYKDIEGVPGYVIELSKQKCNEFEAELQELVTKCGGMCTIYVKDNIFGIEGFTPQSCVFLLEELRDQLSEEELMAMIYHEAGHLVLGHADAFKDSPDEIVDNVDWEIDADSYACQYTSPSVLMRALYSAVGIIADWAVRDHPCCRDEAIKIISEDQRFVKRIEALTARAVV